MPKLRKHRRAAKKISKAVEARRLAKFSKHPLFRQDQKTIRYRVEIWRVDEPEIRLVQFPMEYVHGQFISREIVAQIAEHLFEWLFNRVEPSAKSPYEQCPTASVWDEAIILPQPPTPGNERKRKKDDVALATSDFQSRELFNSLPNSYKPKNDGSEPF